ncbi:hypothetical protein H8E88_02005, partial [candidate division KSB1 bacterium]|nr:hypothetical protein [candidate division KSB1 bacterium]
MNKLIKIFSFILIISIVSLPAIPEEGNKRPLTHDDYDSWKSINDSKIAVDGKWICYLETPQDGDAFFVVKNVEKGTEFRHPIGYSGEGTDSEKEAKPQFTYNTSHVVFLISPEKAEVDSLKKKKKKKKDNKPKKKLGILNLTDGNVTVIDSVKSFAMPEEAGGLLAYLKEAPPDTNKKKEEGESEKGKEKSEKEIEKGENEEKDKEKKDGTRLVLRKLGDNTETVFELVTEYRFTKNGLYLLYIVSNKDTSETDGVYSYLIESGQNISLLTGKGNYKKWALNKKENYLGFLTDRDDYETDEPTFNLYGWKVGDKKASLWISHSSTKGFPDGMAVSDKSGISFSEDGNVVMFGIKEIPEPKKDNEDSLEVEEAKFDLWHWNDPYPQPQQKKMAKKVRDNTWESVYFIKSKKFVKLADEDLPDVQLSRNGKLVYANNNWPYTKRVAYDGTYVDVYVINPKTGERTLVKKELYGRASISPNAKYLYWFENEDWFIYNIKTKSTKNVTGSLDVHFEREDWDTPNPPRSYGIAGWTDNDKSIIIYDRYDIWEILPDGSKARRITEGFGRKNDLSFRYLKLDADKYSINPNKPMMLRTKNEESIASGFYRDQVNGDGLPEKLVMANK